jgi:hypothetical protein
MHRHAVMHCFARHEDGRHYLIRISNNQGGHSVIAEYVADLMPEPAGESARS